MPNRMEPSALPHQMRIKLDQQLTEQGGYEGGLQ